MSTPVDQHKGSSTGVNGENRPTTQSTRYETLRTGASSIDRLLEGGFPAGQISLVYGKANAGKTILSMSCATEAARKGLRVFYIDADRSFSTQRLQFEPDVLGRILLFQPDDFRGQTRIIENLESLLSENQPALVIVDSVTTLYRVDAVGQKEAMLHNRELNRQLAYLAELAVRYPLTVLLTGQVHSHPEAGLWTTEPVADRTLMHWARLVLRLRQTRERDVREAKLEKLQGRDLEDGARVLFQIEEHGIRDVQD